MPENQPAPVPRVAASSGLRIVLFGMPAAGKSSLLGALAQAAQSQSHILGAQLDDAGGGLAELQQRVYQNRAQETLEEIVPYQVTITPGTAKEPTGPPYAVTFYDCDGRIAQEYMTRKRSLDQAGKDDELAKAIQQTDALILVADVSAGSAQLAKDFALFAQFLRLFQEHRGRRSEVAGLPVHLVLTKCDLLAMPSDTGQQWLQRIKEHMADIRRRFEEFLAEQAEREHRPFGRIDLHVAATAVKRPALADRAAKPQEPLGVAELFRQCLESARKYAGHRQAAEGRLQRTVLGVAVLVGVLGILAAVFFLLRPDSKLAALENNIRAILPASAVTAAKRLEGNLEDKQRALAGIQAAPDFSRLSAKLRDEVKLAAQEIAAYQQLERAYSKSNFPVKHITREDDLAALEKALDELKSPPEFAESWTDLDLVKQIGEVRREAQVLRKAVDDEETWFKEQLKLGEMLRKQGGRVIAGEASEMERARWISDVKDYLERRPRFKAGDRLPGAPAVPADNAYKFVRVDQARQNWEAFKLKIEALRKQVS